MIVEGADKKKKSLTLTVSVSDMDIFQEVLEILGFAYNNSSEEVKQEIGKRLEIVLGKTHDTERILHD